MKNKGPKLNHRESFSKVEWGVQRPGEAKTVRSYGEDGIAARYAARTALPGHKLVRRLVERNVYEWEEVEL